MKTILSLYQSDTPIKEHSELFTFEGATGVAKTAKVDVIVKNKRQTCIRTT